MNIFSSFTHSYHFLEIDSTSTYLKRNYQKFPNMTFVSSDFQTMGRGRNARNWISEKNTNLLFSFLVKDPSLVKRFDSLSILSAVAVKRVLDKLNIHNVSIKWPNDVYVKDRKCCGILLDGISEDNHLVAVIIGIGLNVNQSSFPNDLVHPATSIKNELGKVVNLKVIKRMIYKEIKKDFKDIDRTNYLSEARRFNYLKNKEVYCEINHHKQLVKVIDIADDNSLIIKLNNEIIHVKSGEVTFHL